MFIDSSVIVAILSDEPEAADLAGRIETSKCVTSSLVILESAMRLSSKLRLDPVEVGKDIQSFMQEAAIDIVAMDGATATLAIEAFAKFGKGRGHPAQLNLADCMSYACAKAHNVSLLYKGDDFAHTDLR